MSYFLSSFFQKRLLRYAFSRLEFLDTDALDLEKLEIGWGKRSTVELRDVGLHTKKLSTLLRLPQGLSVVSAEILYLRLTIPADLYKTGILVEARGWRICIDVDLEQRSGHGGLQTTPRNGVAKRRKGSQPREARRDQSHVHDPGGPSSHEMRSGAGEDSHTPIDELPTTTDLANSFLQAEPKEEKAELQASVILSKPLDGSMQSNEASDLGVGNNLSLPAFLADFLKGVGDRIKLEIQDVELDLTLKVNRFSNGFQDSDSSDQMEDVILRLSIGKMDIEAVSASEETSDNFKDKDAHFVAVQERRRIIFTKIRVAVISEASLFADLAKSTVPPSPMSVHARSMARVAGKDRLTSASVNSATSSQLNAQQDIDQNSSKLQDPDIMNDVEQDPGIPCSLRTEGDSIHAQRHKQNLVERERPEWVLENPSNSGEDFVQKEQKSLQKKTVQAWESSYESDILHRPVRGQQDSDGIVPSQIPGEFISGLPTGHHIGSPNLSESQHWHDPSMQTTQGAASDASPPYSNQSSPDAEGLAESKIFTHEEASLYMSAVSGSLSRREDESVMIPGKWNSSSLAGENRHDSAESSSPGALGAIEHDKEQASRQDIQSSGIGQLSQVGSTTDNSPEITRPRSIGDEVILLTTHQEGSATLPHKESNSVSSETEGSSRHSKVSFPVSKAIISIDLVIAVVPTGSRAKTSNSQAPNQCDIHKSQRVPGSFEQKSEGFAASSMGGTPEISENDQAYRKHLSYSVEIGEIQILGDVGLTKMLILVIEQLNAFHNPDIVETDKNKSIIPSKSQGHDVSLVVKEIRWLFLDAVVEKPILRNPHGSLRGSGEFGSEGSELLLRADLNNFRIVRTDGRTSNTTKIVMGKVSFGYRSEDILSFDSDMKMRDSTRDVLAPTDDDIILIITQSQAMTSADLTTLPLHIVLDLRRLDETFSWFGGFSSVLDLGSSMMSTVTIVDKKPRNAQRGKKKRGVHFENSSPSRSVESHMTNVQNKVTARIGGFVFDLEGTRSSMRFGSTAMKIVSRAEGLGLQVDRVQLRGPELKLNPTSSPVTATLTNLRVEYLSMPKEVDLARLLNLVSPSKDKDAHDDDILLETLLRQRRQGAVVRATTESLVGNISRLDDLQHVSLLAEELKKLSAVAKYLPEDDRPGILALVLIKDFQVMVSVNSSFGKTEIKSRAIEGAHVTFPTLMALGIDAISVNRNGTEELLGPALPAQIAPMHDLPTVMARYIGNEMEPTVKIKLHSLHLDYHVSTVLNIMGLTDVVDTETVLAEMISSVITVAGRPSSPISPPKYSEQASRSSSAPISTLKSLKLDIALRDIVIGLNPHQSSAKGLFVFSETYLLLSDTETEQFKAVLDVKKGSLMLIDNVDNVIPITTMPDDIRGLDGSKGQVRHLSEMGYVPVGLVSAAKATVQVVSLKAGNRKAIDVEIRDNLLVLETCADSTQTLQNILNGLKPPMPVSLERKYLTEVVPIEDMLASFTGDAFATTTKTDDIPDKTPPLELEEGDMVDDEVPQNLEFVSSFYNPVPDAAYDEIADSMLDDDLESLASPSLVREIGDKNLLESFQDQTRVAPGNAPLYFREDHFGSKSETQDISRTGTEPKNDLSREREHDSNLSPLRCRVRDVHIIWNLYDGYDWQHTRDTISHAVESVQNKAMEQNAGKDKRKSLDPEDEENSVIGDFLFNSIYIGIPANHDPRDLTRQVNRNIDDLVSESEDYTSSTTSRSPSRQEQLPRPKGRQLNLKRSRSHKMTFELKGVSADITVLPPGSGETLSSIDLRVRDLEIFDHVPTSTWKKFATYMHDAGERQSGKSMIHLEILNVKPVPDLAASEIILKASILPLRLHVDQDALDFMTRFFEFKDDTGAPPTSKAEPPFLQRVEVNSVQVKLDFKPKRVNYTGIRSGHTTEFMNFFILDRADLVLRHVIIYGVSGFQKLGKTLNDIWMPDVKRNQLPGILAGLAAVRSLVNVGSGVRDLVVVPIREYQKDGRIVRSFQKGAVAFAKTTTSELVKLGAKLAIGTQTVLQGAENLLSQPAVVRSDVAGGWENADLDAEEKEQISHYADQPVGVIQGLRGGYASLERDLLLAKDAIIAMPGEVLESGTAGGAAKAVLKGAPTVILRPAMGVSKAVGQTLMGATNSLDPENRRRVEEKYKRH